MLRALSSLVIGLLLLGAPAPDHGDAGRWPWPVQSREVIRPFDAPEQPWSPGHRGIDIRVDSGAVVIAVDDGIVHYAGRVVDRGVLSIDHGNGVLTSYEPVQALVARGEEVSAGQPVAIVSGIHASCGACLHFGVRVNGEYADPLMLLTMSRPVLLPVSGPGVRSGIGLAKALE